MAKNPYQGDDVDPFSGVRDEESGETAYKGPSEDELDRLEKLAASSTPKKKSFKDAFADARRGGEKSFTWNGKKYSTEMAKAAPKVDPDAGKGPTDAEISRLERRARATSNPKDNPYYGRTAAQRSTSMKAKGGAIKMATGGSVSASRRADGIAQRGKTKGRMV